MATKTLRRAQLPCCLSQPSTATTTSAQQTRHASLLRRPHRPYTFTQLVTLSDGSTYLTRTTSPQPIFRSTKDTRNSPLWQPSLAALRNQEQDEAGRLRAFRERFGRGWDLDADTEEGEAGAETESKDVETASDSLMDLISGGYEGSASNEASTSEDMAEDSTADGAVEMITVRRDGRLVRVQKDPERPSTKVKKAGWGK